MPFDWDKTQAAAMKILGKDGEVPDAPANLEKSIADVIKLLEAFDKSREDLEAKITDVENANDAVNNILKKLSAQVEKSDLGLDPKKKDDLKKIQQARKILLDRITHGTKVHDDMAKMLDELDKHTIQLSKYKAPKM